MSNPTLITTPVTEDLLRGHLDVETTAQGGLLPHRLPAWARRRLPDAQFAMVEAQPSGVRLTFRTAATTVELETVPTKRAYPGLPAPVDGVYDLLVDGALTAQAVVTGGRTLLVDMATGSVELQDGPSGVARFADLPAREKAVEIWLPHNETAELLTLRTDAPVAPEPVSDRKRWLHHGSSISHGSNAASPTAIWPALAAATGQVELVNLGFGGSALLDPFVARTMRDTPADLVSLKIGINVVNADVMRLRAFGPAVHGFLDTIRDGHPTTPLLVVSPIFCPVQEDTPGPLAPDFSTGTLRFKATGDPAERAAGRLTLATIRAELARIVAERAADDPNLHHLDGRSLYGPADYDAFPLPDAIHPDPAGHRRIAENFARSAFGSGGPFAAI
ncbi:GDSL-type esterase/lipase family protein [Streptacidiphilus fuscans]|uniref:Lipase n=1 Tax=Streptacidiphilus fuscans TaxID=2789292 RepID=A0A931B1H8_9ACTN|nr:GDSL-type esterase/lipase family protein [Streptacidiphilus fuscans]MBF9068664.1 lipase [Streptacidiphilus fuscans]